MTAESPIKRKQKPRLSEKQWDKLRAEYEGTNETVTALAKKYKTHGSTISVKANREGWIRPKAKKEAYQEAHQAAMERVVSEAVDHVSRYFDEQIAEFARAKAIFKRHLIVYDVISQFDVRVMDKAYEKAKTFLIAGDVDSAHAIISKVGIDRGAPSKVKTIVDNMLNLDTAERRLLGLERNDNPDQFKDDPMQDWLTQMQVARKEYEQSAPKGEDD